jgi:hypothetical protein
LTLHYFKVLQRLQMKQERYGVRLCWAPSVRDPARTFFGRIESGKAQILAAALAKLPAKPTPPVAPTAENTAEPQPAKKWYRSEITDANAWTLGGGMNANYDVDIDFGTGYEWDGDTQAVTNAIEIFTDRPQSSVHRRIVGVPFPAPDDAGNKLRVKLHIDAPDWFGGPGIGFQVGATFQMPADPTALQNVENTVYADTFAAYQTALADWTDQVATATAKAQESAEDFAQRLSGHLSPLNEMVSQIVEQNFPADVRDECWEIDLWQKIFDWERATFMAYPGWWSSGESRDPLLDPSDFVNASWAKLYLPVRPGMEKLALRWIFGKALEQPLDAPIEARFDEIVADLRKYRTNVLGTPDEAAELTTECQEWEEKALCIAKWTDLMPTDGTHVEVVQGVTSAVDAITAKEIADAAELRTALLESEKRSAQLKDKALVHMTEPATVGVRIGMGTTDLETK